MPLTTADKSGKARRGGLKKGEERPAKVRKIAQQRTQMLPATLNDLSRVCDRGTKCNAQDFKNSWNGYKLHIDTADCGVPVSVLLTSASVYDARQQCRWRR